MDQEVRRTGLKPVVSKALGFEEQQGGKGIVDIFPVRRKAEAVVPGAHFVDEGVEGNALFFGKGRNVFLQVKADFCLSQAGCRRHRYL